MNKIISLPIALIAICAQSAFATQAEFEAGFKEGYKTVKGDLVIVPITPIAPITPIGSNDYREGLKAGMRAAQK